MVSPYVVYLIWYGLQCILKCQVCQMLFYVLCKVANNKTVYCMCRFFKSSKPTYASNVEGMDGRGPFFSPCRSADCCGVKLDTNHDPPWLECDDETVRTLTKKQFEEILAPKTVKNSALTPYLLFYCRLP